MTTLGFSESAHRNTAPILEVLREHAAAGSRVLEIGAGTGQHALAFSSALPEVTWQPADRPDFLADVQARYEQSDASNLLKPQGLDLLSGSWPAGTFDIVLAINVIHIAPWPATAALFSGAAKALESNGKVILYGPYRYQTRPFEPSNASFDASLRSKNTGMGIRDFEAVNDCAMQAGFTLQEDRAMPANNRMIVWDRS